MNQQLFNFLDEKLTGSKCDDRLRLTQQFTIENGVQFELVRTWLKEQGGYCDCEVLANVEERFEKLK